MVRQYIKRYYKIREDRCSIEDRLYKGPYYRRKGKRYTIEVVTTAKKLLLDNLKDIKGNLGEAQN